MKPAKSPPDTEIHLRIHNSDLLELPWESELQNWTLDNLRTMDIGLSRHEIRFVQLDRLYAIKQLPQDLAAKEFRLLQQLTERELPCITPVGYVLVSTTPGEITRGYLISEYLDYSIPYWSLFQRDGLHGYQNRLLDALAMLLVNLHLNGFYWGDCSLSNVLFRRDAGRLQAYLVDVETSEMRHSISDQLRSHDLDIMVMNMYGDLFDLSQVRDLHIDQELDQIGKQVATRYQELWIKLTSPRLFENTQRYKIREYIEEINRLGFSVDELELQPTEEGNRLTIRPIVTDRNYHRNKLNSLTGIDAEENQAMQLLHDLQEYHAVYGNQQQMGMYRSAHLWYEKMYLPVIEYIQPFVEQHLSPPEIYCQVLEHKWYLSEEVGKDVGLTATLKDYRKKIQLNAIIII